MRILGWTLIVAGLVLMQLGIAGFTATAPPPLWLNILGGIGFWGWWIFLVAGVQSLRYAGRRSRMGPLEITGQRFSAETPEDKVPRSFRLMK